MFPEVRAMKRKSERKRSSFWEMEIDILCCGFWVRESERLDEEEEEEEQNVKRN